MNALKIIPTFITALFLASCYTKAKVEKVAPSPTLSTLAHSGGEVHAFRLNGLQNMQIVIMPKPKAIQLRLDPLDFSQEELSELQVYVKSLDGPVSVNSGVMTIHQGEEKQVHLRIGVLDRKNDGSPIVGDLKRYHDALSFVNVTGDQVPPPDCDIVLTIVDPTGISRTRGLKIAGGFQDSL